MSPEGTGKGRAGGSESGPSLRPWDRLDGLARDPIQGQVGSPGERQPGILWAPRWASCLVRCVGPCLAAPAPRPSAFHSWRGVSVESSVGLVVRWAWMDSSQARLGNLAVSLSGAETLPGHRVLCCPLTRPVACPAGPSARALPSPAGS